jgi:hypothetical protein
MPQYYYDYERTIRWMGHVAHWKDEKCLQNLNRKTLREETALETPGVDDRTHFNRSKRIVVLKRVNLIQLAQERNSDILL